ncbi:DoxX family protein [Micromonospora halotolerans]|uniref:DoxX family protein n=1 Tax=Micromonospora halotolerans TaxID=709879 RepID=A0ABY9ZWZ7_9ACTN|nr:DoxX family protein [Micromonospora halotolerans]WNM39105.1 DoxX family protein [Micromonospora halotolerans]
MARTPATASGPDGGATGPAVNAPPTAPSAATRRRYRTGAYWLVTAVVVGECAVGGAMDLFRMAPFYPVMIDLGYPSYLATIMGTAKIIAAVVVLAPGLPRLKEWAYAGIVINMVGAVASHVAMHQTPSTLIAPAMFAGLAILSWAWRPPARRL